MRLAFIYSLLAVIATAINIGTQDAMIRIYHGKFGVVLSVLAGTAVGLVSKYILDKRYIFNFQARNAIHDTQTFVLYTAMGIITTFIFWGFEFGFDHIFKTKELRYVGGIIGLAIGYVTKYHLDKRFVFCNRATMEPSLGLDGKNLVGQAAWLILLALPFFWMLRFYLSYASSAWFWSDDFYLISQYANSWRLEELSTFSNLGRFVSRNLYWHFGWLFFAGEASLYFLLNLALISCCAIFSYRALRYFLKPGEALAGALIYFASPAVVHAYVWISNSQHLVAHLFVLLYILTYLHWQRNHKGWMAPILFMIYIAGLFSNIFAGLVVSLPAWYVLNRRELWKNQAHWALLLLSGIAFVLFYLKIKQLPLGPYAMSISLDTIKTNAIFYFTGIATQGLSVFMAYLAICIAGVGWFWRQGKPFHSWVFLASPLFYLPFAFLAIQRYEQYFVLPLVFFLWGCLLALRDWISNDWLVKTGYALVLGLLLMQADKPVTLFNMVHKGTDQKALVDQMNQFIRDRGTPSKNYCFSVNKPVANTTGVAVFDIPPEWWWVWFGTAFNIFSDPSNTYVYKTPKTSCDASFVIDGKNLTLQSP